MLRMTSEMVEGIDICPTEDAVLALLEHLVDPKLPAKSSTRTSPSQLNQEEVAKQVHAVVLLYNYFYRKQHPQLEFLGFESFCKLAVILRPSLLAYMRLMQISNDSELVDLEKQLSLTEKKIMDACDISTRLDASVNAPSIEGWPISKVAVLLIDFRKEHCFLQFSSITEGVWSMIEKDVKDSNFNSEGTTNAEHVYKRKKFIRKRLRDESGADEANLQQLALSAIKDTTGFDQNDFMVLDSSVVYSTSKEKTATRFYIMHCVKPNNSGIQLPIRDVIQSLQGSLFIKHSCRWTHTSVVEYFHLLPYTVVLLKWFSKEGTSLNVKALGSETINENSSTNVGKHYEVQVPKGFDQTDVNGTLVELLGNKGSSLKQNEGYTIVEVNDSSVVRAENIVADRNIEIKVQPDDFPKTSAERCLNEPANSDKAELVDAKLGQVITENSDENVANGSKKSNISSNPDKRLISSHASVNYQSILQDLDEVQVTKASRDKELSQTLIRVILRKRDKLSLQLRDIEDQIARCDKSIQTILDGGEDHLIQKIESIIEGCDDACLRNVTRERSYHSLGHCSPQCNQRKKLLDTVLDMQNPCQELDDVCYENNWILPTYHVSATEGGFRANIMVKGKDFECSSGGEVRSSPREARESAATLVLAKLQK